MIHILLVEDDENDSILVERALQKGEGGRFTIQRVETTAKARVALAADLEPLKMPTGSRNPTTLRELRSLFTNAWGHFLDAVFDHKPNGIRHVRQIRIGCSFGSSGHGFSGKHAT